MDAEWLVPGPPLPPSMIIFQEFGAVDDIVVVVDGVEEELEQSICEPSVSVKTGHKEESMLICSTTHPFASVVGRCRVHP